MSEVRAPSCAYHALACMHAACITTISQTRVLQHRNPEENQELHANAELVLLATRVVDPVPVLVLLAVYLHGRVR